VLIASSNADPSTLAFQLHGAPLPAVPDLALRPHRLLHLVLPER
jgi:hypothetical protein